MNNYSTEGTPHEDPLHLEYTERKLRNACRVITDVAAHADLGAPAWRFAQDNRERHMNILYLRESSDEDNADTTSPSHSHSSFRTCSACSGRAQDVFRPCSGRAPGVLRACSGRVQDVLRSCS